MGYDLRVREGNFRTTPFLTFYDGNKNVGARAFFGNGVVRPNRPTKGTRTKNVFYVTSCYRPNLVVTHVKRRDASETVGMKIALSVDNSQRDDDALRFSLSVRVFESDGPRRSVNRWTFSRQFYY